MNDRLARLFAAVATVGSLALVQGAPALADPTAAQYYNPPKLVKQGTPSSPISGNGTVVIQVLVNPDGTFKVQKIVKSTNHALDQAAMDMAQTAQYAPATKGGKKIVAFYTYTLKFVGASTTTSDSASGGTLAAYNTQVRAGKYAEAKTNLTAYLQAHPSDPQANALLGVADFFLDDFSGATAAFDKAGTIPTQYKTVAANAYARGAEKALAAKDGSTAVADAKKANELSPGAPTLNLLGNAQIVAGDYAAAVRSLEQARSLAATDSKVDAKQRGVITANLVAAYVDSDQPDKAVALLPDVKQLDPSNTGALGTVVAYYAKKAQAAQKAGNVAEAVSLYDKAASLGPEYAPVMYANEAFAYMSAPKPDWKAVKATADKALAIKPDDAGANLAAGVALANDGKQKDAIPYLQKADASAKAAGDKAMADKAEQLLKQLNAGK